MTRVLVAYTTKTGTTRDYAEALVGALRSRGIEVELRTLAEAGSLEGYDAVILGSPINGMQLVPEASGFLEAHRTALAGRKTAVFTVSYMHGQARGGFSKAIEGSTAKAATIAGALDWKIFPGRIDKPMPALARLLFGLPGNLPIDRRDLEAARTWAAELAGSWLA